MTRRVVVIAALASLSLSIPSAALAHCDSVDGPVVKAAAAALTNGDLTPALRWVSSEQETELRAAFADARAVRDGGARARDLADRFFFETIVRLHRQSEGEPFTGLKPAGHISEALADADRALDSGNVDRLIEALARKNADALRARFAEAMKARAHAGDSVEAGRHFVEAYVAFMHYVEKLEGSETPNPHR
jgi:hypothetical protein